jgi:hypothetical protein
MTFGDLPSESLLFRKILGLKNSKGPPGDPDRDVQTSEIVQVCGGSL